MSYILEALRKSDQQRQQGAAPALISVQLPVAEVRRPAYPWLIALAAAVFITGILVGWLQPWKTAQPTTAIPQPAEKPSALGTETYPLTARPARVSPPVEAGTALTRNSAQAQSSPMPALPSRPLPPSEPVPDASVSGLLREDNKAPAADLNAIQKADLPSSIQQELPSMKVSLHAYSTKPKNRLVSVNDKFLQEGDALMPGLVLEQITPRDMIFSYKGLRFHQAVQ